ncbi:hypothetical protein DPMN_130874 [Dreissena polymorpha]|uniref:Uncharacterized protein n=1 Tax=Dreissena polymorpha TaxID=45954 RepID=A0A9D4JZJ5_DREPO|nr:hypothetical protein DPMN_130874 [Dreissena polymorpha]
MYSHSLFLIVYHYTDCSFVFAKPQYLHTSRDKFSHIVFGCFPIKTVAIAFPSNKCTTRQSPTWNPHGKRKRGRPRNTWRHHLCANAKQMGQTWERLTQNRDAWRKLVGG